MYLHCDHMALRGMCAAVPENTVSISKLIAQSTNDDAFTLKRVAALAGLQKRHVASKNMFTGDLAIAAGRELLLRLHWSPASLDLLCFVTQTPDYLNPPTGYLIGAALGVTEQCAIIDLTSGCPGMLHGAWVVAGQLGKGCQRALVLSGDAASKVIPQQDLGNSVLMGDGVGAMALEYDTAADPISFYMLSDPDTQFSLINHNSGFRQIDNTKDGMIMDGAAITKFCLNYAPKCIKKHLEKENLNLDDIDIYFLHQPNKMIIDTLRRRMNIDTCKTPTIFADYANCSSASLAINVCMHATELNMSRSMFCAFGSGLAVASMLGKIDPLQCFQVVQVK